MVDLSKYKNIVVLTGAGISAESGIKTFRDQNGLWEGHDIATVASPQGFERDPQLVHDFYNLRRSQLNDNNIAPNPAHYALSNFEKEFMGDLTIVTQNVDNLHERSGSQNILHMHGELLKVRCIRTAKTYNYSQNLSENNICECCQIPGNLRPHIVWFGEIPLHMNQIQEKLETCDLFVSIGTSGVVYPAAMFVQIAKTNSAYCIEFNQEKTQISSHFDECITGPASVTVPRFFSCSK